MATDRDDRRLATPGSLKLVRDFVNTLDVLPDTDKIGDPASLAFWLAEHRLVPTPPTLTDEDLRRARSLREALRALLLANAGFPLVPEAAETFGGAVGSVLLHARADEAGRLELRPTDAGGLNHAIGGLASIVLSCSAGRALAPPQGLRGVPLGALRPHQEPFGRLVRLSLRRPGPRSPLPETTSGRVHVVSHRYQDQLRRTPHRRSLQNSSSTTFVSKGKRKGRSFRPRPRRASAERRT